MTPPTVEDLISFRFIVGLVVGLVLGSFVTMASYRLPRGLSIVKPGSSCPFCKARLRARDLVPVFSWLYRRGHCAHCSARISARYPLIELITGLTVALLVAGIGLTLWTIPAILAIVAVITTAIIRIER